MTDDNPGSRIMGGANDLQSAIDALTQAVSQNTASLQRSSSSAPGGTPVPFGNTGQTFTSGSFPRMQAPSFSGQANATQGGGFGGALGGAMGRAGGGGAMTNPGGTLSSASQTLQAGASGFIAGSSSQFSQRLMMNQFASQTTLMMGPGNLNQQMASAYKMGFGYYGQPGQMSALAQNASDQAQMWSNLQGASGGAWNPSQTQQGRAVMGATSMLGIGNPTLGGAQASAAIGQLYSPMTSFMMRQMGYGVTPRAGRGGQWTNGAQVMQGMMQKWFGKGSVSQATLNSNLAPGGNVALNLGALGLNASTMGPMLQVYNKLAQQGINSNQINAVTQAAASNGKYGGESAQKWLSQHGVQTSDIQKMKDVTATSTANTSGTMGGFDTAVTRSTTLLQSFNKVLGQIMKVTGLGEVEGGISGMSGIAKSVGGVLGTAFSSSVGLLSRLGGAGGSVAGASTGTGMGTPGSKNTMASISPQVKQAVKDAEAQVGKPYQWGGDTPQTSFDCSGLIEWAYAQAGIKLPRKADEQWAALKSRSIPLNQVMEGDIVFAAGSDGSEGSPGHEALMISNTQIVEAPSTGQKIRIRAYNPGEWQHAGRPTGNLKATGGAGAVSQNGIGNASTTTGQGNSGSGLAAGTGAGGTSGGGGIGLAVGTYGSSSETDDVSSALLGGITGGSGGAGLSTYSGGVGGNVFSKTGMGNGQGSTKGSAQANGAGTKNVSTAGGGSNSANRALAQKLAAAMYGWTGSQWANGLLPLWTQESGFNSKAQNPTSTAFGIAQFLDSTWGPYGSKTSDPGLQIKYGLEYIKSRYGSPLAAEAHERAYNWYAAGTDYAKRGAALVGERGPELVHLSGGQQIDNAGKTSDILKGHAAKTAQGPWSTGTAQQLMLGPYPQNSQNQQGSGGQCNVNLNMPAGAIVIHTQGSSTDVSNATRQIMEGVSQAMADNETLKKIMSGVTS